MAELSYNQTSRVYACKIGTDAALQAGGFQPSPGGKGSDDEVMLTGYNLRPDIL